MIHADDIKEQAITQLLISALGDIELLYRDSPRKYNVTRIIKAIYASPGITRKGLVTLFRIRPGTVTEIVAELITDKLVFEVRQEHTPDRGRPEITLHINKFKWLNIVICCISREMQGFLVNLQDEIICQAKVDVPFLADNSDFEEHIAQLVRILESENSCPVDSTILGISFSVPGIVDSIHKAWVFSSRWPNMRNLVLGDLQQKTGFKISIRRQLDVQLNYHMLSRPELRLGNTLLFHWGYGIGGAFASNGEIIGSQTGIFCQIGHIAINPDSTKPCICGKLGCLESEAAYWALQPEIARVYGDIVDINENQAADFLKQHSIYDQLFFKKAQKHIAHALSYLQAILVPDHVLLYGLFLEDSPVQELLVKKIKQLSPPFVAESMKAEFIKISNSWNTSAIAFFDFKNAFETYIGASNRDGTPSTLPSPVSSVSGGQFP